MFSSTVIKKILAKDQVMEYEPRQFKLAVSEEALNYVAIKENQENFDFQMADVVRIQTGVREIELSAIETQLETKALEKLKVIQESAYKEAFELGRDEGKQEAFKKYSLHIEDKLKELSELLLQMKKLKLDLVSFNEAHIVKLVYYLASRLAMKEIGKDSASVLNVMKQAIELADEDENILVRVAPSQIAFLEELKNETTRELDFVKNVTFEADKTIEVGGCVIETNYGEIDARIEERVAKLWDSIEETVPLVKSKVG